MRTIGKRSAETAAHVRAALEWILANRRDDDGTKLSMRRIMMRAGLSPTLADQINRGRQSTISGETTKKLGERWNVKINWILTGQLPIEPYEEAEAADPYPTRPPTLTWARRVGYSASVIDRLAKIKLPAGEADPGGPHWMHLLEVLKLGAIPPQFETVEPAPRLLAARECPEKWRGFWAAADGILLDNPGANRKYYGAVIGFSKTPTDESPPKELTTEWLWPRVRAFHVQHRTNPTMPAWHDDGVSYHDRHKPTPPGSRSRPTANKPVEKRNRR